MTNGFKPGFHISRTIPRPVEDGTRKGFIIVRLYDINVERIKMGGRLSAELAEEWAKLVNEYHKIEWERYNRFIETRGKDESI